MILTCPQCDTRYQADEAKFPPAGRNVRCAKCGNVWHQAPPSAPAESDVAAVVPEATPDAPAAPFGEGFRRRSVPPPPAESRRPRLAGTATLAGWLALVAIILLIGFSAVRYRQEIATLWPQSFSFYAALGLPVHGLDFRELHSSRQIEDGQTVLAVSGMIVNDASRELPVPQTIRVILSDGDNREVYRWTFGPGVATLKPGQSAKFTTRLSSPPVTARHLEIHFVKDGE